MTGKDPFLKAVIGSFQQMVKATASVAEMVGLGLFPWCVTPELYAAKPEYIQALADFVRSRPAQSIASFIAQSTAVIGHDAEAQLGRITAPTLVTFGRHDVATSTRFAERMKSGIRNSDLLIFEGCSHAPIYEKVEEFNAATPEFLTRQRGRTFGDGELTAGRPAFITAQSWEASAIQLAKIAISLKISASGNLRAMACWRQSSLDMRMSVNQNIRCDIAQVPSRACRHCSDRWLGQNQFAVSRARDARLRCSMGSPVHWSLRFQVEVCLGPGVAHIAED